MHNFQKEFEKLDLLDIEHSLIDYYGLDRVTGKREIDKYIKNVVCSSGYIIKPIFTPELICRSSVENIKRIIESLEQSVSVLNDKERYKRMDAIESKLDQIQQKILYKIYDIRYGDKHRSFAIYPKKEVRFMRVESARVLRVDSDGVVEIILYGTSYRKGGKKLGKRTTAASVPEGYAWYKRMNDSI